MLRSAGRSPACRRRPRRTARRRWDRRICRLRSFEYWGKRAGTCRSGWRWPAGPHNCRHTRLRARATTRGLGLAGALVAQLSRSASGRAIAAMGAVRRRIRAHAAAQALTGVTAARARHAALSGGAGVAARAAVAAVGREHDALLAARASPARTQQLTSARHAGFSGATDRAAAATIVGMAGNVERIQCRTAIHRADERKYGSRRRRCNTALWGRPCRRRRSGAGRSAATRRPRHTMFRSERTALDRRPCRNRCRPRRPSRKCRNAWRRSPCRRSARCNRLWPSGHGAFGLTAAPGSPLEACACRTVSPPPILPSQADNASRARKTPARAPRGARSARTQDQIAASKAISQLLQLGSRMSTRAQSVIRPRTRLDALAPRRIADA